MTNLAKPGTGLARFVDALSATAAEVAPVAQTQADMFVSLDTTFTALAEVARPYIQETISETPPTLDVATSTLPVIRPFLANSAVLFTELQPGIRALSDAAPAIASSLEVGTPVLRDSPQLNRELPPTAAALARFNDNPVVRPGIARLRQTVDIFGPALRFIAPAQTVCNYGSLLFRNTTSLLEQRGTSAAQRFTVFDPPDGTNNEGSPSSAPANGGGSGVNTAGNFLHYNPYPNTASPGQTRECEAGNEPYVVGRQVIGNAPGNQGIVTEDQPWISEDEEASP
jgi:ABC-type transporter Mla subunit MlaD